MKGLLLLLAYCKKELKVTFFLIISTFSVIAQEKISYLLLKRKIPIGDFIDYADVYYILETSSRHRDISIFQLKRFDYNAENCCRDTTFNREIIFNEQQFIENMDYVWEKILLKKGFKFKHKGYQFYMIALKENCYCKCADRFFSDKYHSKSGFSAAMIKKSQYRKVRHRNKKILKHSIYSLME
jgi:hypothetical protein